MRVRYHRFRLWTHLLLIKETTLESINDWTKRFSHFSWSKIERFLSPELLFCCLLTNIYSILVFDRLHKKRGEICAVIGVRFKKWELSLIPRLIHLLCTQLCVSFLNKGFDGKWAYSNSKVFIFLYRLTFIDPVIDYWYNVNKRVINNDSLYVSYNHWTQEV